MSLPSGTRLGPYEITSPLGAGGMGEVYRAHDPRLGRDVALKVISPDLAHDPDRVARFEREARAASALADAHIVAVFDVGEDRGVHFFASELVEGPTLHQLLLDGALPVRKALELAAQIAQGLAVAHEKGIVHRDLKPANVLIAPGNVAKIADFGLAKATGGALATAADSTETGILLGTVTYMSPEQAAGKRLDGRSDQFALGSILFEMLVGRALFRRATGVETMTAILREDPDLSPLDALQIPPSVAWILERCLSKDPEGRYASTKDLARELRHLQERTSQLRVPGGSGSGAAPGARGSRRGLGRGIAIGLLLGGLAAGLLAGLGWRGRLADAPPQAFQFFVPPPAHQSFANSVEDVTFAFSPDGSALAFVAADLKQRTASIWLRTLDAAEPRPLAGTEGGRSVFWSPDGGTLGFFAGNALWRVATGGSGGPVRICDVTPGSGLAASWGRDGTIAYTLTPGEAIYRVPALGGTPTVWHARDEAQGELRMGWPQYLPDGTGLLYTARGAGAATRLRLLEGDAPPRDLGPIASRFEFLDSQTLVHARDRTLVEQRFDVRRGLIGAATPIAPVVSLFRSTLWAAFAVSRNGALAWHAALDNSELAWFDRNGVRGETVGSAGAILAATVSADGRKVLSARIRPELGTYDIWGFDLERGTESRLTSDPDTEFGGLLSPDGRRLFYSAVRGALPAIIERDLASGEERPLLTLGGFQIAQAITGDGRTLVFSRRGEGGFELWTVLLDGHSEPLPFIRGGNTEIAALSPDGLYAAFISAESGTQQAYVARVAAPAERVAISRQGARELVWVRDEILYLSDDGQMISIPVKTSPHLDLGQPKTLFTVPAGAPWGSISASPDGRRLLAAVRVSAASEQPLVAVVGHRPPP